jgi:hypothetical protein
VLDRLISTIFGWLMLVRWVGTGKKHFSHCKRLGCKGSEVVWSWPKRGAKWDTRITAASTAALHY